MTGPANDRMAHWLWDQCSDEEKFAAYSEACDALSAARTEIEQFDYLVMRNVAHRFKKRWRLRELEDETVWSLKVGGTEYTERVLPGEIEAVRGVEAMDE